jgi:hypothetical protein
MDEQELQWLDLLRLERDKWKAAMDQPLYDLIERRLIEHGTEKIIPDIPMSIKFWFQR